MKALLALSIVATLLAGQAFAACQAPANSVKVPNGSKASKDEMLATQRAVKDYDAAVKTYADCLKSEQEEKLQAGGASLSEEQKQKINMEYAKRQNEEVDKLEKLAAKFNLELKAYKAKNPS
jgi:hypothetical protein